MNVEQLRWEHARGGGELTEFRAFPIFRAVGRLEGKASLPTFENEFPENL
jgi:hypothetical protein